MGRLVVPETFVQDHENWLGQLARQVCDQPSAWPELGPGIGSRAMRGERVQQQENGEETGREDATDAAERRDKAALARPVLQALARLIATDRRAVVLANLRGDILLTNGPAQRLGLDGPALTERLDWPGLCRRAQRAGSVALNWQDQGQDYQGELVQIPLGPASGFLLRLSESDQEAALLRNRARSATLMRVAHDLRTPIQSLLATAEALLDPQPEAGDRAAVTNRLRRAAELALDHVSNVLGVIRGERSVAGTQPDEDFRIAEELRSLIALVEPIAAARATEVTLTVDAPEDLLLHGPLRFVRALCQNMIDNSVNHGGGRVQVLLSCKPLHPTVLDDDQDEIWAIRVEVRDEGGGLPPAQRARLSEALGLPMGDLPAPAETTGKRPSAGLNVLAHALKQLGGQITVADRGPDGEPIAPDVQARVVGTVLAASFSLPRAPELPDLPRLSVAADAPLVGRSIVLVEDSPASRDWLSQIVESFGAEVLAVGSGPEALALLARKEVASRVELVLTDVTLPRMSGIELARVLRAGDPSASVPWRGRVVGLTAHVDPQIRAACLEAGMLRVLEKPIRPQELSAALVEALADAPIRDSGAEAAAAARLARQTVLDEEIAADLIERLGQGPARDFMNRALAEARTVLEGLKQEGIGPDTPRQLHAATGASGLTGLVLVEKRLRAIELAVAEDPVTISDLFAPLEEALEETRKMTEKLS
ncbi:response regulator [Paracoccus caeni]|uniref:histidine kinase n=1 Tax=Paracoccus caeni TaxID=657651 RepID=A0A934W0L0_9RHOB|nr:response regulator [Paracoccus caeni]MBK4215894.1 response regulator [Paracoccus caeni]